jgi:hypothetical protein
LIKPTLPGDRRRREGRLRARGGAAAVLSGPSRSVEATSLWRLSNRSGRA